MVLVAKNPPANARDWETWVQPLGWKDPLEEGMPSSPVFLPGEFHGQKSMAGFSPQGSQELDTTGMT